ncbi:hypothetical protein M2160_008099 [Streptomyces sp. SAI-117]|uniref:hypothetical protein n=1 Tax=Streptomyces sp. SAI-117 TaxID=2940546 RepID=UPI002473DB66|nr:hypothetical protein [Streptomyces sp. SAI-117]MDH6573078.1 hypothetical protein [Streptomyces sp. SAI-117]
MSRMPSPTQLCGAPLAAMAGTAKRELTLPDVPQPRSRDQMSACLDRLDGKPIDADVVYR